MSSKLMKPRILVDISLGHRSYGFSGIPQDARLLFNGLLESDLINPVGLTFPPRTWTEGSIDSLEKQSIYLGLLLAGRYDNSALGIKALRRVSPRIAMMLQRLIDAMRKRYDIWPLDPAIGAEMIWRNYFASTLSSERKNNILNADYELSSLGMTRMFDSSIYSFKAPRLNTEGYNFLLSQDSRVIKLSAGTKKVIRYHDGIPIFASDTLVNLNNLKSHYNAIQQCANDGALYVCNSPSAKEELGRISEEAASKAVVIPYFIPRLTRRDTTFKSFESIARVRISQSTAEKNTDVDKWLTVEGRNGLPKFIMTLSTIEPRKNIIGLINAWQRMRHKHGSDAKLLIVGSPGWEFEPILKAIRPFVKTGDILHLEKVAQHELEYLYSAASCFVFPSFAEGFGLPPTEAMQCGCPVLVSDIPAHRYASGNAALYCDPYSEEDIANKISYVLDDQNKQEIQKQISRGYSNAERFSHEAVLPMWEEFFCSNISN